MNTSISIKHRALPGLAVLLSALAGISTYFFSSTAYVAVAVPAYLFFVVIFALKPDWALFTLLFASFCTAIAIEAGPVTIRPDQIIVIAIVPSLVLYLLAGNRPLVTTPLDWLIVSYWFCNVLSSLVNSPILATSLQKCVLLFVTFLSYFVTTQLLQKEKYLVRIIWVFLFTGILEAFYGVISVVLFTRGINLGGAHAPYDDLYARGTFLEGNIFGSFQMIVGLFLISFLFNKYFREKVVFLFLALLVVLVALIMSYTRSAWIGFGLGLMAYFFVLRREWARRIVSFVPWILVAVLLLAGIGIAFSTLLPAGTSNLVHGYVDRFTRLFEYKTGTGSLRLQVWAESVRFWMLHPILGNGTDSIKALAQGTDMPKFGEDYWIPNSLLLALHDTGLIGLFLFLAIQVVFLWNLRRTIQRTDNPFYRAVLEGFFISFIAVQFTYLFTNAFWLIFIWVFMGIGAMCAKYAMLQRPVSQMD